LTGEVRPRPGEYERRRPSGIQGTPGSTDRTPPRASPMRKWGPVPFRWHSRRALLGWRFCVMLAAEPPSTTPKTGVARLRAKPTTPLAQGGCYAGARFGAGSHSSRGLLSPYWTKTGRTTRPFQSSGVPPGGGEQARGGARPRAPDSAATASAGCDRSPVARRAREAPGAFRTGGKADGLSGGSADPGPPGAARQALSGTSQEP